MLDAPADRRPLNDALLGKHLWEAEQFDEGPPQLDLGSPAPEDAGPGPSVIQFTLPASECGELLRLLSRLGVDAAALFPGYGGVVRSLREMGWMGGP